MPAIRSIPFLGDLFDTTTSRALEDFQKKKQDKLIDVILSSKDLITSEAVNDVEFIINFSRTLEAVNRLATTDKIEFFGNLLCNGYFKDVKISNDFFEECTGALNELSYRELQYLAFFKKSNVGGRKNQLSWRKFILIFAEKFNLKQNLIYSIFYRIKRTGFVDELLVLEGNDVSGDTDTGYSLDSTNIDSDGFYLTETFNEFYLMITKND